MKSKYGLIGFLVTVIGYIISLIADWASSKQLEELVDEKVNEALANQKEEA